MWQPSVAATHLAGRALDLYHWQYEKARGTQPAHPPGQPTCSRRTCPQHWQKPPPPQRRPPHSRQPAHTNERTHVPVSRPPESEGNSAVQLTTTRGYGSNPQGAQQPARPCPFTPPERFSWLGFAPRMCGEPRRAGHNSTWLRSKPPRGAGRCTPLPHNSVWLSPGCAGHYSARRGSRTPGCAAACAPVALRPSGRGPGAGVTPGRPRPAGARRRTGPAARPRAGGGGTTGRTASTGPGPAPRCRRRAPSRRPCTSPPPHRPR